MILNRTVRIGRRENSITYDEIKDGVFVEGVCLQRGLGIAPATIAKHIKTLVDNKLVAVRFDRSMKNGFMYSLYSINTHGLRTFAMGALPIPRKQQADSDEMQTISRLKTPRKQKAEGANSTLKTRNITTSNNEVTGGSTHTTFSSSTVKGELKFSGRSAHCKRISRSRVVAGDTVAETMQALQAKAKARGTMPPPEAYLFFDAKRRVKHGAFMAYWNRTVQEHYPQSVKVGSTVKEFCVFRASVGSVWETISPPALIEYLVAEWKNLLKEFYVSSAKWKPSDVPDIQSVVKHWKTIRPLLVAHFSAEAIQARNNAGLKERAELKEARATKETVAVLQKTLEAERSKIARLEREKADVYTLARRNGVDLAEERKAREARKEHTRQMLDAQHADINDDDLPDWQ